MPKGYTNTDKLENSLEQDLESPFNTTKFTVREFGDGTTSRISESVQVLEEVMIKRRNRSGHLLILCRGSIILLISLNIIETNDRNTPRGYVTPKPISSQYRTQISIRKH